MNVKRTVAATGAALLVIGGGTAAYAYWTTTGSGTGSATTGTSTAIVLYGTQVGASTNLTPGGPGVTVSFTADNPSTGNQLVNTITLVSVDAYPTALDRTNGTLAGNGPSGVCDDSQYSMVPVVQNQDIPAGNGTALLVDGTLVLANLAASQDGCKGAFLTLNLTSN